MLNSHASVKYLLKYLNSFEFLHLSTIFCLTVRRLRCSIFLKIYYCKKRNWTCTFCIITLKPLIVDTWKFRFWINTLRVTYPYIFTENHVAVFHHDAKKENHVFSRPRRFSVKFRNSGLTIFFNVPTANKNSHLILHSL